jgi:hypothetical protein
VNFTRKLTNCPMISEREMPLLPTKVKEISKKWPVCAQDDSLPFWKIDSVVLSDRPGTMFTADTTTAKGM